MGKGRSKRRRAKKRTTKRKTRTKPRSKTPPRQKNKNSKDARGDRLWIGPAIKRPGALRRTVQRRYGGKGFTQRGTIRRKVITELAREPGVTGKRARLAKTLREL